MAINEVFASQILSVVVTDPAVPQSGDPCRYGFATGVAVTDEAAGGNPANTTSVDFGMKVWSLPVTDSVGGGIAVGDTLFYNDAADDVRNNPAGFFFGIAMEAVGVGATTTIRVLHLPSPGSGTIGAGTINTANMAAGILSADAPGRALMATNYFTTAKLLDVVATDQITNAVLLQAVLNGAFQADAPTLALFADAIWTQAKLVPASLDGTVAKVVADVNVIGGVTLLFRITATALTGDLDVLMTHKVRVINAWTVNKGGAGGAGDTITIKNDATAITDAMDLNKGDNIITRPSTMDDAQWDILAGHNLRITGASAVTADVYVEAIRVA